MIKQEREYVYRTPGLLVRPFFEFGKPSHMSLIRVIGRTAGEARERYEKAVRIGKELGWYR